ncbi:DUF2690 domain-containing protein [Streptomyces sp. NPDC047079]|uniref:DUF2690 domain-containing protein n=1 Tax=Streptomyces sp. NPDC047079 TaxID=3154607 RepID=UPI0034006F88
MPGWKALPEELDPQVREFAGQLRRLVDRSGMSVSAVADRTGYSKTSWERYLGGRLLAPKGAVVALAEVTGTDPVHVTTLWERAEHAWSRAETRHDMTMDALRISQARAAPAKPEEAAPQPKSRTGPAARGAMTAPGIAGPAGAVAGRPPQPTAAGTYGRAAAGGPPGGSRPDTGGSGRKPRLVTFLAGLVGALVLIAAAFFLTGGDGKKPAGAPEPAATSASAHPEPPVGVKCGGASCTGKDPEKMGCGGTLARSSSSVTVGTILVEVRYSRTCGAVWARITRAERGDTVEVSAGGPGKQTGSVTEAADTDAYTPMVAVKDPAAAKACVTQASGRKGCTK